MLLEDVQDCLDVLQIVYSGLVPPFLAECHGAAFDGQHVKWRLKMLRSEDASSPHDDVELRCGHDDLLLLLW